MNNQPQPNDLSVPILEPHQGEDAVAKAKGLGEFGRRYGEYFGRIQIVRMIDRDLRRLSLDREDVRLSVERVASHEEFLALF